jgi:uncharacterized protein
MGDLLRNFIKVETDLIALFAELSAVELTLFLVVALLIGMSKTGIHGTGMLAVPLLALIFGGMGSSGILLPILCIADIFGVVYYHRHASWSHLRSLFPSAAAGIVLGSIAGAYIDDVTFKMIIAVVILGSIALMIWLEGARHRDEIPHNKVFSYGAGVLGGFTSMIGNVAGSIMAVYFLSVRLPKNVFIGTTAWFFLVINLLKVPFHVFHWKTISGQTFLMDLATLPIIALGAFLGVWVVKRMTEKSYRWFILGMTALAALFMLYQTYS